MKLSAGIERELQSTLGSVSQELRVVEESSVQPTGRLRALCARVTTNRFVRSITVLASGTAAGQAVALAASPFLTRIYSASDFGQLQIFSSVLGLLLVSSCWRYESVVLLAEDDEIAANALALAVGSAIVTAAATLVLSTLVVSFHLPLGKAEPLRRYVWLLSVSLLGGGTYLALSAWVLRKGGYSTLAVSKFTQVSSTVVTQLGLGGVLHYGYAGMLFADALGRLSACLQSSSLAWNTGRHVIRSVTFGSIRRTAARYKRFPLIAASSGLIEVGGSGLPLLLIGQLYGSQVLGWLALSNQVLAVPNVLIAQSISQVYVRELAGVVDGCRRNVLNVFHQYIKRLMVIAIIPSAILFVFAEPLFAMVFGENWREAGAYSRLLSMTYYAGFVISPLTPTLDILEQQSWHFVWVVVRLTLTSGAVLVAHTLGYSPRTAIIIYGAAMILGYFVHLGMSEAAIRMRPSQADDVL